MTLAGFLEKQGIKPSVFADSLGVAPSTILRIINRERLPGLELALQIREATGGLVQPDDFLTEPEPAEVHP